MSTEMQKRLFNLLWFGMGLYWGVKMDKPGTAIVYFLFIALLFFVVEPLATRISMPKKLTTYFKALWRDFKRR